MTAGDAPMTRDEARQLAEELLAQMWKVDTGRRQLAGWRFRFDRARRRIGSCRYGDRTITLSGPYVDAGLTRAEVEDTLRHEVAHALVGQGHGHGPVWREQARLCGVTHVAACKAPTARPPSRWVAVCPTPSCDLALRRNRRTNVSCPQCSPTYDVRFRLVFVDNPEYAAAS